MNNSTQGIENENEVQNKKPNKKIYIENRIIIKSNFYIRSNQE